jgi:glycerol uptake facilitator-like aquaporin
MNPAVSLAMYSLGKLPLAHFPLYLLVQTLGAFFGAALCFLIYADQIHKFDGGIHSVGGPTGTGNIFCSFPQPHVSHLTGQQ